MLCVDHTVSTTVSCIGALFDSLFVLRLGNGVLQGRGHEGEYQPMSSDFPLSLVNHIAYYAYFQYNAYEHWHVWNARFCPYVTTQACPTPP